MYAVEMQLYTCTPKENINSCLDYNNRNLVRLLDYARIFLSLNVLCFQGLTDHLLYLNSASREIKYTLSNLQ